MMRTKNLLTLLVCLSLFAGIEFGAIIYSFFGLVPIWFGLIMMMLFVLTLATSYLIWNELNYRRDSYVPWQESG